MERYFTVRQVATRYRVGIATVWRWVKEQDGFPEPVRLSKGTTRWCETDLLRFEIARRAGK
ncbi:AlpA family transcriptional regulator [Parvibaculum sedimenti]|uniref:AlpA family transcriptional regulator n=1 Tax=Parvibaculum sedimenti TaxID=2608632 RepID=A0A6N6VNX8_9HYPH|nr:AlpA family transcriptional regulator [Parvibaculum sedimenti]